MPAAKGECPVKSVTIQRLLPALLWATLLAGPAPRAAEPRLEKTDLFEVGEKGYLSYRIPALVVTSRGTVLAFCGARKTVSDWAVTQLLMRRSTDGGQTWTPRRVVAAQEGATVDCPVPIVDRITGSVHFLYQVDYARCYYTRTDDEGRSFTSPVEITEVFEAFRPEYDWTVMTPSLASAWSGSRAAATEETIDGRIGICRRARQGRAGRGQESSRCSERI